MRPRTGLPGRPWRGARTAIAWAALFALAPASGAFAMPADPNPHTYRQPDGTEIVLKLRGDEWLHWHEDANGYPVVLSGDVWVYARVEADGSLGPTAFVVGQSDPATLEPLPALRSRLGARAASLRMAAREPVLQPKAATATGTFKNLVVLCQFSDHTVAANGRQPSAFDSLFNMVGGTGINAPSGSVRDYYTEASYNQLTMVSTVAAWVTLPQTEAYYADGKNGLPFGANASPYPKNATGMVTAALNAVDSGVNFADFDQNNDGYVDAITFIHSGRGGEQNGNGVNTIWSHKYNLSGANGGGVWTSTDLNANGVAVKVDLYHTEPALYGTAGNGLTRVGVVAHELGHFFGLPDLYDTDNSSSGAGNYCLMANSWGWNQDQRYPPHPSAWARIQLGWATSSIPAGPGLFSLDQVETAGDILRLDWGLAVNEYLLVENRQPVGFDRELPHGGLAVWHIDDNVGGNTAEGFPGQSGWPGNGNHYQVALLQADGNYDLEKNTNKGDSTDVFHDVPGIALSEATSPSTDRYNGLAIPTGVELSEISASGPAMTVRYRAAKWVDFTAGAGTGAFTSPFNTLIGAINASVDNNIVICKGGTTSEKPSLTRPMRFKSYTGTATIGQ